MRLQKLFRVMLVRLKSNTEMSIGGLIVVFFEISDLNIYDLDHPVGSFKFIFNILVLLLVFTSCFFTIPSLLDDQELLFLCLITLFLCVQVNLSHLNHLKKNNIKIFVLGVFKRSIFGSQPTFSCWTEKICKHRCNGRWKNL